MFLKNSRYYGLETVQVTDRQGRTVTAVKLRGLDVVDGPESIVAEYDQLDAISKTRYRDPTRYWHIADANTELEAEELTRRAGRIIEIPEQ
jgi:hypothetical protein